MKASVLLLCPERKGDSMEWNSDARVGRELDKK